MWSYLSPLTPPRNTPTPTPKKTEPLPSESKNALFLNFTIQEEGNIKFSLFLSAVKVRV